MHHYPPVNLRKRDITIQEPWELTDQCCIDNGLGGELHGAVNDDISDLCSNTETMSCTCNEEKPIFSTHHTSYRVCDIKYQISAVMHIPPQAAVKLVQIVFH